MSQTCPSPPSDPRAEEPLTDGSSSPPSILRKRPPVDHAVGEKRKAERRVRFREPEEVIERAIPCCDCAMADAGPSPGSPALLWLSLCALLLLAASLCYTSLRQDVQVLEEFRSRLVIVSLQIRHIAQKCWTWFTRQ
ncbi:PREDICTED: nutritionally-regulated adipose and cardiac enriched protein homolog [Mesitornis unicolor]|uniref:nutritionally-regulated adipose and cardiac enriched protein homolog n=1 Tax=Mesitornis unicolor TaxID=54374 RepID=UPI0005282130|nr:PREDICTED: nutritionally-regulated adipose and cardiac enriched protein homolog [Mesitornis unicolor]